MISGIGSGQSMIMQAQNMFAKVDTDQSNSLNLEEFKAGAAHKAESQGVQAPSNIEDIFAEVDTDGNGELSEAEFTTMIENGPKGPPPPPKDSSKASMSDDTTKQLLELLEEATETSTDTSETISQLLDIISGSNDTETSSLFSSSV